MWSCSSILGKSPPLVVHVVSRHSNCELHCYGNIKESRHNWSPVMKRTVLIRAVSEITDYLDGCLESIDHWQEVVDLAFATTQPNINHVDKLFYKVWSSQGCYHGHQKVIWRTFLYGCHAASTTKYHHNTRSNTHTLEVRMMETISHLLNCNTLTHRNMFLHENWGGGVSSV